MSNDYKQLRETLLHEPSAGVWELGGTKVSTIEESLAICKENFENTKGATNLFCEVYLEDGKRVALIGNGPSSIKNGYFIAAANPDTIRALLAERDALAAENAALREECERDAARLDFLDKTDCGLLVLRAAYPEKHAPTTLTWSKVAYPVLMKNMAGAIAAPSVRAAIDAAMAKQEAANGNV